MSTISTVPDTTSDDDERLKLNDFLANCTDLRTLESKLGGFSLFRVLGFEDGEIRHSNVLAWLFNPEESHGLHDDFLKRFLVELKAKHPNEPTLPDVIDVETARFDDVDVKREWAGNARDRLDLLVLMTLRGGQSWVLAIEVKVNAQQGKGQLEGYKAKVQEKYSNASPFYVFLTKNYEKPAEASGFLEADFTMIHTALSDCLDERGDLIASGPKHLIEDYRKLLERRFMPDNNIATLVAKIYKEHRVAIDTIINNKPDFIKDVSDRLKNELPKAVSDSGVEVLKTVKGVVYLLPTTWKTLANVKEKGTVNRFLYIQLDLSAGRAKLRIMLEGGEDAFRKKVADVAKPPLFGSKSGELPKSFASLYIEDLGITISEEEFGVDKEDDATNHLISKITKVLKKPDMGERIDKLSLILKD